MIYTSMFNSPLGGSEPAASPGSAPHRRRPTCHPPSPSLPPPTAPPLPLPLSCPLLPLPRTRMVASRTSHSLTAPLSWVQPITRPIRSEEHTSELQSLRH